jgi:hypothetical protein
LLWIVFIVAPGGVFLLPLLVGDAMARRKKAVSHVTPVEPAPGLLAAAPLSTR